MTVAKKAKPAKKRPAAKKPEPPPVPVYPRVYYGAGQELMKPQVPMKKGRG
jgi:hypothetical protein